MWSQDQHAVAGQEAKPRVVQHQRRRYSIRLEAVFWNFLEYLAQRQGQRLGRFIGGLAASYGGKNLSSYLRVVCMLEAERAVAEAGLDPTRDSLLSLVRDCPSPGVVISRSRTIIAYNSAFAAWLGPGPRLLAGSELTEALQVRTPRSLNEVWTDMITGAQGTIKAHVLRVRPGQVSAAQATLVPLRSETGDGFHAVMWLEAKRPRSLPEHEERERRQRVVPSKD